MTKGSYGENCILARSLFQDLTFKSTQEEFTRQNVVFCEAQKKSLGLVGEDGMYTNLDLLLSDQCQHTFKVAVFEGTTKSVFKSRKEFSGSLIKQLSNIVDYLDYFNLIHASVGKLHRNEHRDYPVDAIRESIINALVHREYGLSASTFANVYDDRMEFLSVGGIVPGISLDAIMSGVSHSRNEKLAAVFCLLGLVQACGTGISRIMGEYADCERKPEFEVTDTSFKTVLPNMRLDPSKNVPIDR